MTTPGILRILVVAAKRDAQPVLDHLRSGGHHVSLVEDLEEAAAILDIAGFDQAVLPVDSLHPLLEQRAVNEDREAWRRSTAGIAHDLRGLLAALGQVIRDREPYIDDRQIAAMSRTIETLSTFAEELLQELVARRGAEWTSTVDLEGAAEAAAMVIYPSATERSQRLVLAIDDDVAYVNANPPRLKRTLKNLLEFASSNAPDRALVSIGAHRDRSECVISVSYERGEGTGLELGSTFSDPRRRTRPLALAQELAEQMSGRMWVESGKWGASAFVAIPHRLQPRESISLAAENA